MVINRQLGRVSRVLLLYGMGFHSVEIYSQGVWAVVMQVEDPELQELADKLPSTVLRSRANSTVKKYLGAYKRWKN